MAFSRKDLSEGGVSIGSSETTIYSPASTSITGVVGTLSFHNTSTTTQVQVTVYGPHTGAASSSDILDVISINPGKTVACIPMVNAVVEGSGSKLISALASTTSVINAFCSGAEE